MRKLRFQLIALIAGLASASASLAATRLGEGVLVNDAQTLAYAVTPAGSLEAIDLNDGRILWTSAERAWPLDVADGRLWAIAQGVQRGTGVLLAIDPADGQIRDRIAFDVPEQVDTSAEPRWYRRFQARLAEEGGRKRVYWHFWSAPKRGALIQEEGETGAAAQGVREVIGAFDIEVAAGQIYAVPVRQSVEFPLDPAAQLAAGERLPNLAGLQYRAADEAEVLVSEPRADAVYGRLYRWQFHSRSGGSALGSFDYPLAYAPFLSTGGQVLVRAGAIGFDAGNGWEERPVRLLSIDLASGRERWSVPLYDTQPNGAMPP